MVVMIPTSFGQLTLGRRAEFLEQFDQCAAFSLRQAVGGTIHGLLVGGEHVRDASFPGACEMDHTGAPVARVRGPRHETALLEPSRDTMLRSAWRTSDRCAFMSTSQT
jgi:hypothetical protein